MNKILFISPDASLTGAPIILLNFIKWVKYNSNIPFFILIQNGGELLPEFKKMGPTLIFFPSFSEHTIIQRVLFRFLYEPFILPLYQRIIKILYLRNITHIYSNTVVNGHILRYINDKKAFTLSHIHELENTIKLYGDKNINNVIHYTNKFIAVSKPVKKCLIDIFGVPNEKILHIPEFIDLNLTISKSKIEVLNFLKIPSNAFIVGGSGTTSWRKGVDIFLLIADQVINKHKYENIYFVWVGKNNDWLQEFYDSILFDVKKLNLKKNFIFTNQVSDPFSYYQCFDIFALPSREDPFPLVCLENALLKKPIICFKDAGGMPEFVDTDSGFIVDYLNVQDFALKIIELYENSDLLRKLGERAFDKLNSDYNPEFLCSKIFSELTLGIK